MSCRVDRARGDSPRACPGTWRFRGTSRRPESPPTGIAPSPHDLHPGVLLRVVRGGDHDPAVEAERADREVDHLRPDEPDVDHVGARLGRALDQRRRHRRRGEPRVAPDGDPLRRELLDVGAPDRARAVLVDLRRVDPAHVVRLEHVGIEHRASRMLSGPSFVSTLSGGTQARNRALRRPGRLDRARHRHRPGGRAPPRDPLLRRGRALRDHPRRDRREVRRRRRARRLRRRPGARGRRGARDPGRSRHPPRPSRASSCRRGSESSRARSSSTPPIRPSRPARP